MTELELSNFSRNFQNIQLNEYKFLEEWFVVFLRTSTNGYQIMNENLIRQYCHVVNDIKLFDSNDECIDFVTDLSYEKVCLIVYESVVDILLPLIYDLPQIQFIYIIGDNNRIDMSLITSRAKIKGSFSNIVDIFHNFKQSMRQSEYDLISISIVSPLTDDNINELDALFMYSQLLKDIILKMQYNDMSRNDFVNQLRKQYADSAKESKLINKFDEEYSSRSPFWWYSKETFIYEPLNHALRTQNTDILVSMGFYIQDLHREIERLSGKQCREKMIVYRGQAMKKTEFEKLQKNKGGLLSFNNFLSTSTDREVSFLLADSCSLQDDSYGIAFQIEIDPSISSVPYACFEKLSQFETEKEILFSMHTIFRIDDIKNISERIWQVNLISTDDNDEQLKQITECICQQIQNGSASISLGYLLFRMGKYNNAKKIIEKILAEISSNDICLQLQSYNMLGGIAYATSDYPTALTYCQKILDMCPLPDDCKYFNLSDIYNNMGLIHHSMKNYSAALEYYEIVTEIRERSFTCNPLDLGQSYNNMAVTNTAAGQHRTGLKYFQKALDILESSLPLAHPDLASIYNNIGMINDVIGEHKTALFYFEKTFEIQKKSLPSNHLSFVATLNNLGSTCHWIGQYQTAMEYFQNALQILKTFGLSKHSDLSSIHNNIAQLYKTLGEYDQALSHYFEAIKTQESNDPNLSILYINTAMLYRLRGDYFNAIEYLEKAEEIQKTYLPVNHPDFIHTYNSFGLIYQAKNEFYNALSYYEKALAIQKAAFFENSSNLFHIYNNMAGVESFLGHNSTALNYINQVLSIQKLHLPSRHPEIARTYMNMGTILMRMNNHTETTKYFREAFNIYKDTLPRQHPEFGKLYFNVAMQYCMMGDYHKALEKAEKAHKILEMTFKSNHPELAVVREGISKIQQIISCGRCIPWTF